MNYLKKDLLLTLLLFLLIAVIFGVLYFAEVRYGFLTDIGSKISL